MKYRELIKKYPHIAEALALGTDAGNKLAVVMAFVEGEHSGYIRGSEQEHRRADHGYEELLKKSEERVKNLEELLNDGRAK